MDVISPRRLSLGIPDPNLRAKYENYNQKRNPIFGIFALTVFFTAAALPYIALYGGDAETRSPVMKRVLLVQLVGMIIGLGMLWILIALKLMVRKNWWFYGHGFWSLKGQKGLAYYQDFCILVATVFTALKLFLRVYMGPCDSNNYSVAWTCNPQADSDGLPIESLITSMILPLLYSVTLRDLKYETIWISWCIVMFTVSLSAAWINATNAVSAIIIYGPTSAFLLMDNQRQNLRMFMMNMRTQELLAENERMQAENRATELRHMIANVAHDLKTPLASFLSGIEIIASVIHEFNAQEMANKETIDVGVVKECLSSIQNCVKGIKNTNSFMIMTINRCIDFTKASQGLKLVPKPETIDLQDTLHLPLHVMKDMQARVVITMEPIPTFIAKYIITDKQWLQENVLCLLSNAVKYSNRGSVTVSMRVVQRTQNRPKFPTGSPITKHRKSAEASTRCTTIIRVQKIVPVTPTEEEFLKVRSDDEGDGMRSRRSTFDEGDATVARLSGNTGGESLLRIDIEDTGIGLTEEAMENLFNPFKQAQRLAGGTGLGLYSLAKRVEALNGEYGVQRRRDGAQGSLFWFAIPYRPDDAVIEEVATDEDDKKEQPSNKSMMTQTQTKSTVTPTAGRNSLSILLVDDSVSILKMTSMMLARQGHVVTQAENGAEALDRLADNYDGKFDVVLMDLQMPVMDGLEAIRRLRRKEKEQNGPNAKPTISPSGNKYGSSYHQLVIGVSANSDNETTEDAYKAGVDGFMSKPFALSTFYETFHRLREQRDPHKGEEKNSGTIHC